jgi:hypothetical protein
MNVMRTSRCGTVNTEILPVCSMDTRNSMESVNCTPVQVKVKQTGRCGTVRSRVLPVCSMDIGNGVQTTSGTSCDKQEQKYTIDTNGTRQGSVLSPAFFAIYIDDLLQRLRGLGVGCHIGDKFLGAAGFADDIVRKYENMKIWKYGNMKRWKYETMEI